MEDGWFALSAGESHNYSLCTIPSFGWRQNILFCLEKERLQIITVLYIVFTCERAATTLEAAETEQIQYQAKTCEENIHVVFYAQAFYANLSGILLCNYVSAPKFQETGAPCWRHSNPQAHLNQLWKPCATGDKGSTNMPERQPLHIWYV